MKLIKYITEKPLWVNILAGIGLLLVALILFFLSLGWLTNHGDYEKVPPVTGQHYEAAIKLLEEKGFEVIVQDSVYIDSIPKQFVVRQSPEGDATVKSGRTIYLTINRMQAPQIEMPSLIGFSLRSAEMYLQSLQLKLGTVTYKPDIARNAVLEQWYNGAIVAPGTKVPTGSVIHFVLGSGEGISEMVVPDLVGMTLAEARSYLTSININIGSIVGIGNIRDSAAAFVVKQQPDYYSAITDSTGNRITNKIKPGQLMDIYISENAPVKDTARSKPF